MKDFFESDCYYHIYNHANGKENLFLSDENYLYFLRKYAQYISPIADTLAYCLMPNHFHFFIRVFIEKELILHLYNLENSQKQKPKVINELGELEIHKFVMLQFQHFLNGYTQAYNKMYERKGSLFLNNLNLKKVESNHYYSKLVHYIHFNPVHHGFCKSPEDWKHSSYHSFLSEKASRLKREEVTSWFGGKSEFIDFHQQAPDRNFKVDFE